MSQATIPLLITSAVNVTAGKTRLSDPAQRLQKTLEGIARWRRSGAVGRVVVCDGSGVDLSPHVPDADDPRAGVPCEFLHFTNSQDQVRALGKGYGEGEIVRHALAHSPSLANSDRFAKCTGKLWVSNAARCIRLATGRPLAFDYGGVFRPVHLDTRFYVADTMVFRRHLLEAYLAVDETQGHYLEHAYRDALKGYRLSEFAMFPTPRIEGTSGSMNLDHRPRPGKDLLRDARSLLVRTVEL
jgi:hypothetical protein